MALQLRAACDVLWRSHVPAHVSSPSARAVPPGAAPSVCLPSKKWGPGPNGVSCHQEFFRGGQMSAWTDLRRQRMHKSSVREHSHTASVATDTASTSDSGGASDFPAALTYLEGNSWLWNIGGVQVLIDPVLVGPLDFGIPALYKGFKRVHRDFQLGSLPDLDVLLITQGLDDHCHKNTLLPLSQKLPDLPVVAAPSAKPTLDSLNFRNVVYLKPGESHTLTGRNGKAIDVQATAGPVLGPPWQLPENGYVVRSKEAGISVYLEPHCVPEANISAYAPVDVVVTPIVKQVLPAYVLVDGQEVAVKLAAALQAKYVVPMMNGELEASGLLSALVRCEGTLDSFKALLAAAPGPVKEAEVLMPEPGVPLPIPAIKRR